MPPVPPPSPFTHPPAGDGTLFLCSSEYPEAGPSQPPLFLINSSLIDANAF